jgi:signal transduction histidine kinase
MQAAQLIPVLHIASPSPIIMADGRLLWRVFDNLLSNAVKYAMPGTRVYLDLKVENSLASLMLRNISKTELNVPTEELLERFVRGDRSRHTEGSGLGLSIARSLTELMGGELSLEIDGDLFKVMVKFPVYTSQ